MNNPATLSAYDYYNQKWVTGEAAKSIIHRQATESLDLLKGPKGAEYCRYARVNRTEAISNAEASLASVS